MDRIKQLFDSAVLSGGKRAPYAMKPLVEGKPIPLFGYRNAKFNIARFELERTDFFRVPVLSVKRRHLQRKKLSY